MTIRITASATYHEQGDFVEIEAFLTDPATDMYVPNSLSSGEAVLVHAKNYDIATLVFDRFNGNVDGGFKMLFLHPPHTRNIEVRLTMDLNTGDELQVTIPVLLDRFDLTESLSPNVGGLQNDGRHSGLAGEEN